MRKVEIEVEIFRERERGRDIFNCNVDKWWTGGI